MTDFNYEDEDAGQPPEGYQNVNTPKWDPKSARHSGFEAAKARIRHLHNPQLSTDSEVDGNIKPEEIDGNRRDPRERR